MAFASVTRLRLRSVRFLPGFLWLAFRSSRQAKRAEGFHSGAVLNDHAMTFWTLTLWDREGSMRRYMMAGAHRLAMPKLIQWCDEASVVHWATDGERLPSWLEAHQLMRSSGRASKVRYPTPDHEALTYRTPRTNRSTPI